MIKLKLLASMRIYSVVNVSRVVKYREETSEETESKRTKTNES